MCVILVPQLPLQSATQWLWGILGQPPLQPPPLGLPPLQLVLQWLGGMWGETTIQWPWKTMVSLKLLLKVPYVVFMKFTVFDAYSNMTCIREERTLLIFGPGPALTLLCVFLTPESQSAPYLDVIPFSNNRWGWWSVLSTYLHSAENWRVSVSSHS